MTSTTTTRPRVYVASLSDYNAGRLHGRWIDADQDADAIHAEVLDMLKASREPPAEEWAIHDYEGFAGLDLGEWESFETVAEIARLIGEHGDVFAGLMNHFGGVAGLDEARTAFEDGYLGEWDTLADYAASFVADTCDLITIPEFIQGHIDYDGIGRDLEIGGDVFTVRVDGKLHVFNGNV